MGEENEVITLKKLKTEIEIENIENVIQKLELVKSLMQEISDLSKGIFK